MTKIMKVQRRMIENSTKINRIHTKRIIDKKLGNGKLDEEELIIDAIANTYRPIKEQMKSGAISRVQDHKNN